MGHCGTGLGARAAAWYPVVLGKRRQSILLGASDLARNTAIAKQGDVDGPSTPTLVPSAARRLSRRGHPRGRVAA